MNTLLGDPERGPSEDIDPLALAVFAVRDHIRFHSGCADRRGLAGHRYDESQECALRTIIKRYGDVRADEASSRP